MYSSYLIWLKSQRVKSKFFVAFSEEKKGDVINNASCPFVPCGLFVISLNKTLYGEFMAVCVLRVFHGLRSIFFKKGACFQFTFIFGFY